MPRFLIFIVIPYLMLKNDDFYFPFYTKSQIPLFFIDDFRLPDPGKAPIGLEIAAA